MSCSEITLGDNAADVPSSGPARAGVSTRWTGGPARLFADRSGTAAIEFAIVVLPLLGFVLLIFQVALYHFSLQSLDYATRLAARQVMVGAIPAGATTAAGFRATLLCPHILLALSCDTVSVNAYKVEATSDANTDTGIYKFIDSKATKLRQASTPSFCLGGPSDYVFIDVTYKFPNFLGSLLSGGENAPDGFLLRSSTFFRNEPFAAKGAAC